MDSVSETERKCQRCESVELIYHSAHANDVQFTSDVNHCERNHEGYAPRNMPWSDAFGDDVHFVVCMKCGQMQGVWNKTVNDVFETFNDTVHASAAEEEEDDEKSD